MQKESTKIEYKLWHLHDIIACTRFLYFLDCWLFQHFSRFLSCRLAHCIEPIFRARFHSHICLVHLLSSFSKSLVFTCTSLYSFRFTILAHYSLNLAVFFDCHPIIMRFTTTFHTQQTFLHMFHMVFQECNHIWTSRTDQIDLRTICIISHPTKSTLSCPFT